MQRRKRIKKAPYQSPKKTFTIPLPWQRMFKVAIDRANKESLEDYYKVTQSFIIQESIRSFVEEWLTDEEITENLNS